MIVNYVTRKRPKGRRARTIDIQRLAKALSSKIDSRIWVSFATVGVMGADGVFNVNEADAAAVDATSLEGYKVLSAKQAIWTSNAGALVDVQLEPSGHIVTANYHGIAAGRAGSILFPIFAGDAVLVLIPDGDFNSPGVTAIPCGSNATAKIPPDWTSNVGVPRVLVDLKVPIEIRAPNIVLTSQNGQATINGRKVVRGSEQI